MSPQFRKIHYCQLPTDFHNVSIVYGVWASGVCSSWTIHGMQWCASNQPVCSSERPGCLWCTFTHTLPIHCKVHWRVGRRLGSCRLISVEPLIGSTIREFSVGPALCLLEALCCLYWQSFCQTDHSSLWWMVVGVNRLTLYQECARQYFGPVIVIPIHFGAFFHSGK